MRLNLVLFSAALCFALPAYAGDVQAEVDHFVAHLKRFCIDGDLSVETAQQQWKTAGASKTFGGRFIPNNRAKLEADYAEMLDIPEVKERLKTHGPTKDEYIEKRLRPDRIFHYETSLFNSRIGKRHYTFSAESLPEGKTFVWCNLFSLFSSADDALALVEDALSLKGREYKGHTRIDWLSDPYPNLKFGATLDHPASDQPGAFGIEVRPESRRRLSHDKDR